MAVLAFLLVGLYSLLALLPTTIGQHSFICQKSVEFDKNIPELTFMPSIGGIM